MSEEIATAIGDLAFWQRKAEQAEQKVAELNELCEALSQQNTFFQEANAALGQMTVEEIAATQARITNALIPQLSRLLLVSMIKDDGELYNYIEWDVGELPETGPMRLALQRGTGKTPAVLIAEARAERDRLRAAAWRYRAAVDACDGIAEAEAALFRELDNKEPAP